jgi:acyl carrier protein
VSDHATTTLTVDLANLIATDVTTQPGEPVGASTDLLLTGMVDSLGVVRIVHWLEQRFGFEIDPADVTLDNFQTIDAMVRYVSERTSRA